MNKMVLILLLSYPLLMCSTADDRITFKNFTGYKIALKVRCFHESHCNLKHYEYLENNDTKNCSIESKTLYGIIYVNPEGSSDSPTLHFTEVLEPGYSKKEISISLKDYEVKISTT